MCCCNCSWPHLLWFQKSLVAFCVMKKFLDWISLRLLMKIMIYDRGKLNQTLQTTTVVNLCLEMLWKSDIVQFFIFFFFIFHMCPKTKTQTDNWYVTRLKQSLLLEPIKSGLFYVIGLKILKGCDLMFMF